MSARNSHEFTPKSAERLLDGQGGPAPLARLLDAAAAPGRPHEFGGEDTAVAAFEIHYARNPAAARSSKGRLPIARIAVLAACLCGGGGGALAAATGSFGGSPAPAPSAARVSPGALSVFAPRAHATGGPVRAHGPVAPAVPGPGGSSASSGAAGPAALCRDLAARAGSARSGLEQALASSGVPGVLDGAGYAPLTQAAGGGVGVPDYCALLLRLPSLPQPSQVTRIPASVLASVLTGLPPQTASEVLSGLPAPVLSAALKELPVPALSGVLTELPAGPLGKVLGKLPASDEAAVLTRLPAAAASRVEAKLPPRRMPGAKTGLPAPSALPSRLPVG